MIAVKDDTVELAVENVIAAIMVGTDDEITEAFERLRELDTVDVLAQLFLCLVDMTNGVDVDELVAAAEGPLNAKQIVEAVRARDMNALVELTGRNVHLVVASVIGVIVAFKGVHTND